MFLGLGAYGAAVIAGVLGIRHFEVVLVGVALGALRGGAADRLPVRALHGHLLRHADAGVRHAGALVPVQVLSPDRRRQRHARAAHAHPGAGVRRPTTRSSCWPGPFYYYCLALLVLAGLLMWRIVHSPFGLHLRSLRDNAQKAEYLGVRVRQFRLAAFVISAVYRRDRRRHPGLPHRPRRPRAGALDAFGPSGVHDGARRLLELPRTHRRARWRSRCCRTSCSRSRNTGASCWAPSWRRW